MPLSSVTLKPGIDTEKTETLNEAGYSTSRFIRFRDGFVEKIGGWDKFYNFAIDSAVRALHAWQDFNDTKRLLVGSEAALAVVGDDQTYTDITPQELVSNLRPNFTTTAASDLVTISDSSISNVTTFDSIFIATPVSIGGLILSGSYPIYAIISSTSYQIQASANAATTESFSAMTGATQANPCVVTAPSHTIANGQFLYIDGVVGMTELNNRAFVATGVTANTINLTGINSSGFTAYSSGGVVYAAMVPRFSVTSGSSAVSVTFPVHGLVAGDSVVFPISTTVGGVTIFGSYVITSITTADIFIIQTDTPGTSGDAASMNGGNVRIIYTFALGPVGGGSGYGIGDYGEGGYGTGSTSGNQTGTPITATDWTLDNWGQIALACPRGGQIYYWQPGGGFTNARPIVTGPYYNGGIFVAMPAQILVAWGSTQEQALGIDQDPLTVRWSDQLDYLTWEDTDSNQASSYRLSNGSRIVAGMQGPNTALLWTDIDLWGMQYIGFPLVFGFNKIGSDCGAISAHGVTQVASTVLWISRNNFFVLSGSGASVLPCSVWDYIFQDLDEDNLDKCWAWPNPGFNEAWFFFASASGGTGECDKYVKVNLISGAWDYGPLGRTAGIGLSVFGSPIAASTSNIIYQHEQGYDADGSPLEPEFETGYWSISEGTEIAFIDWILPDMRWGTLNGAQDAEVSLTFSSVMYPGDTPVEHGPYPVTQSTQYINTRIRGRQIKMKLEGDDLGTFWRLGRIKFRWAPSGRR